MKKILVTGITGTIGRNLSTFLENYFQIYGISSNLVDENNIFKCNLSNKSELSDIFNKFDFDLVIHLAAKSSIYHDKEEIYNVNILGTKNLIECCSDFKIPILNFSTWLVYGKYSDLLVYEDSLFNVDSYYGFSKAGNELQLQLHHNLFGLEYVSLRLSNVYFNDENNVNVLSKLKRKLELNELVILNNSEIQLNFIHMDDLKSVILLIINNWSIVKNDVYNVGSDENFKLSYLVKEMSSFLDSKSEIILKSESKELRKYVPSINKLTSLLKWKPKKKLFDELKNI